MFKRLKKYLFLRKLGVNKPWRTSHDNDFIKIGGRENVD